jgi:hypothetical protein
VIGSLTSFHYPGGENMMNTEDGKRGFQNVYTNDDFLNAMKMVFLSHKTV